MHLDRQLVLEALERPKQQELEQPNHRSCCNQQLGKRRKRCHNRACA
jgi:hypothetical protein